ncbi:MAG: AraC family transcriptional regulator [Ferruginibacter sp.]|nr:AraC family transcriptional regulator [Ferruginibacter sp.]
MMNKYDFQVAHPEYFKQLAVKDLLFLNYMCPQVEDEINRHTNYNEIIYTLEGKKKLNHKDRSWTLTEDTSVFIRHGAYNKETVYRAEWEVLVFYFRDEFLERVYQEYQAQMPIAADPPPTDMLIEIKVNAATQAFFYSILPYFTQQPPPPDNLLELKFKELLFDILSNPSNASLRSYVKNISGSHKPSISEIMEANFSLNLSLAEFAQIAHRSLASFKREFSLNYHTTPGKWLMEKRLNYARVLIMNSQKPVNEIAQESGFENPTHFSRMFREKFGSAPLQYRRGSNLAHA